MTTQIHMRGALRRCVAAILIGVPALTGCASGVAEALDRPQVTAELGSALYNAASGPDGVIDRHALLTIDAPTIHLSYTGGAGIARANAPEPIAPDQQFLIASVAKPMTSAVIYQLAEEGSLGAGGVDTTLAELGVFPPEVLAELHRIDGVSYADAITLRHLLTHTSGLRDVFFDSADNPALLMPGTPDGAPPDSLIGIAAFDPERGLAPLGDCVIKRIPAGCNPDNFLFRHHWTPWDYAAWQADPHDQMAGLLNYYLAGLNEHALWKPGEGFHYSDTNYILLGLVIEKVTGHSLHHELRARIFDPLHMDSTYLIAATDPPAGDYDRGMAEVWAWNQPAVSAGVDFSFDWGGGGVVSTIQDLHVFTRALAAGDLFDKPGTLDQMLAVPEDVKGIEYASGLIVFPTRQGRVLHMFGSNGTWAEYYPPLDLVTVGTVDDFGNLPGEFMLHIEAYRVLAQHGLPTPMATLSSPLMMVVMLCSVVLLVLDVAWLAAALWARRRREAPPGPVRLGRWLAAAAFAANLGLMLLIGQTFGDNPFQMMFGFTPQVRALFVVTTAVTGLFGLAMAALTYYQWRRGEGRTLERGMLGAIAAVSLAYAVATGLLG